MAIILFWCLWGCWVVIIVATKKWDDKQRKVRKRRKGWHLHLHCCTGVVDYSLALAQQSFSLRTLPDFFVHCSYSAIPQPPLQKPQSVKQKLTLNIQNSRPMLKQPLHRCRQRRLSQSVSYSGRALVESTVRDGILVCHCGSIHLFGMIKVWANAFRNSVEMMLQYKFKFTVNFWFQRGSYSIWNQ